jgi:uncharacterized protein YbbC (DUF1343 family)
MKNSKGNLLSLSGLRYAKLLLLKSILLFLLYSCNPSFSRPENTIEETTIIENPLVDKEEEEQMIREGESVQLRKPLLGIERLKLFKDSLRNKRIAVVANQTSVVKGVHLVDTLMSAGYQIVKVFSPEHGFRGKADAGEHIESTFDEVTGLPIISLYGNNRKPKAEQLADVDIVIYDIQDVGVRFYTYISTLHYVMEACAENNVRLIVLDRPNPNGHYIDGPVRDPEHRSFVGMHPVPIVYGMTIGEYAMMINGEHWLRDSLQCNLWVIPCRFYNHKTHYELPIAPSPNLRSELAISLYPSLCLFEATTVSVGRGTEWPFEIYGHPKFPESDFCFKPVSSTGAKNPLYENQLCYGYNLDRSHKKRKYEINLSYLIQAKQLLGDSIPFINQTGFFDRLAGTSSLREQLEKGYSAKEIRATWQEDLTKFKAIRSKYLLYP